MRSVSCSSQLRQRFDPHISLSRFRALRRNQFPGTGSREKAHHFLPSSRVAHRCQRGLPHPQSRALRHPPFAPCARPIPAKAFRLPPTCEDTTKSREAFFPHRVSGAPVSGQNADALGFARQDQIFIFAQTSIENVQSPGMPRPPSMPPTVDCI